MASKKSKGKKKGQQQVFMSPERFMREKARTRPLGKCFWIPGGEENGTTQVVVSRLRPSGNVVACIFLIDSFCIGVKDAFCRPNMTEYEFEDLIDRLDDGPGIEEISYEQAHNLIYGAIAFAEEGGISPAKDFELASYILEEDTDDIPLIEYEYGKDGRHFLLIKSDRSEMPYLYMLKKTLGEENFDYVIEQDSNTMIVEKVKSKVSKWHEESSRHPLEPYTYDYPDYPQELSVKHQFIADAVMSPENMYSMPDEVVERILSLPADEAASDLSNIILYETGRTYKAINDGHMEDGDYGAIMHSLLLLTQLRSAAGLDAVLELMRQNSDFADYHLGYFVSEVIHPALYACGLNDMQTIEDYLYQPGLDTFMRQHVLDMWVMVALNHPERRGEIIESFHRLLNSMLTRLPVTDGCDGCFAGFVMASLCDLSATELIPEIEAIFATDCVDTTVAGDCADVLAEIRAGSGVINPDKFKFPSLRAQYARIKGRCSK